MPFFRSDEDPEPDPDPERFQELIVDGQPDFDALNSQHRLESAEKR